MAGAGDIAVVLSAALPVWAEQKETLRGLDAAVGDGDLGITVSSGAAAVVDALAANEGKDPGALLQAAGRAFATANPSTFAALIGGGIMFAAKPLQGKDQVDVADLLAFGEALAARIQEKGKSEPGDKTVLDALLPSLVAGRAAESGAVLDADAGRGARRGRGVDGVGVQARKGGVAGRAHRRSCRPRRDGLPPVPRRARGGDRR